MEGVQGGKVVWGKVNLPPYRCLIHAVGRRSLVPCYEGPKLKLAAPRGVELGLIREVGLKGDKITWSGA